MNRIVAVAGVISVAALAAGCSSSGSSDGSGASSSGATAAATTTPGTSTGGTGASSTPSSIPSSTRSSTSSCATSALKVTLGGTQGAAGSIYVTLDFKNVSGSACTLYGFPGVSLVNGSAQVSPGADRSTAATKKLVTLTPGETGNATLQVAQAANYPASTCDPKKTTELKIYPPNQTAAVYVSYVTTACAKSVHQLTIGAIQAG